MSGVGQHFVGNVSFGPARSLWEEQPTLRELYDQACAGLVRAECEVEELRAEAALAEAERIEVAKMLRSEREMHAACQNERDEALLELGATQAAVAEALGLTLTPQSADEVRQALMGVVGLSMALVKTINELKAEVAGYRDEACRESCRDKAAADRVGGHEWGNI